jgi:hypothetical protein
LILSPLQLVGVTRHLPQGSIIGPIPPAGVGEILIDDVALPVVGQAGAIVLVEIVLDDQDSPGGAAMAEKAG